MMKRFRKILLAGLFFIAATIGVDANPDKNKPLSEGKVVSYDSSSKNGLLMLSDGSIKSFQNNRKVSLNEGDNVIYILISTGGKGKGGTIDIIRSVKK